MIRFVVGLFIFAVALCAYIISTQHGGIMPQSSTVDTVAEAPAEPIIAVAEQPADETPSTIIDQISERDLGFQTIPTPVGAAVRDTLAVLGLTVPGIAESAPDKRFATLIGDALKNGTADAELTASVITLAAAGEIAIPAGLVTADGQIDTATFLKAIVTTAVLVTEGTDPVVPDLSNDPAAVISVNGYDYTITPTDSLAAIAVKFYGDIGQTSRLIQANPIALARPAQMTAGTTISIPAF